MIMVSPAGRLARGKLGVRHMALSRHAVLPRAVLIGLLVATVGLAGCGRKGALEAPPGMAMKAATAGEVPEKDTGAPVKPDKDFVLDPLIK
jgi:predicted small lipoprotein YifL